MMECGCGREVVERGSSECGVSAGTTERRRCQESDVTDEKPALEVEIIAAMDLSRFSLLDLPSDWITICQSRQTRTLDRFSIRLRYALALRAVARHICSILDAQLPHPASYLETCRQPVTVIEDHSTFQG